MKPLYAIRHIPTGHFLPEPKGKMGRGGSHTEPSDCSGDWPNPRLFKSRLSAQRALTAWLMGKHKADLCYEDGSYYQIGVTVEPVPKRRKEDWEIVIFQLILESMFLIGAQLAESGWLLRSGHADGADLAFEEGCLSQSGKMEIFIPWHGFNGAPQQDPRYIRPKVTEELAEFTSQYHPAWNRCSDAAKLLHMRNACQVFGLGGDDPTDLVICWTKNGKDTGGTGTAIRMAHAHDIPVFNLNVPGAAEQLCAYVLNLESAKN